MKINFDEPAFPAQELNSSVAQTQLYWGLTKREYLAAKAAQGMCKNYSVYGAEYIAKRSLEVADALIKALNDGEK